MLVDSIFDMSHRSGTPDREMSRNDINESSMAANIVANLATDDSRDTDSEETLELLSSCDTRLALSGDTTVKPVVQKSSVAKLTAAS